MRFSSLKTSMTALLLFGAGPAFAEAADAEGLQALDTQFTRREEPGVLAAHEAALSSGLKESPKNFELLWRMARLKVWQADGATANEKLKKQLGKEAWNWADQAVQAAPNRVEGYYMAGLGVGLYAQALGILKALTEGAEGKFNAYVDKAMAIDADHDRGGPRLAKGRYFYELPWPKRKLSKSSELLRETVRRHPANLRARFFLAETQLADDEAKEANDMLERIIATEPGVDPAEDKRIIGRAKALLPKVKKELD